MIIYKTDEQIELIRENCHLVCKTLAAVASEIKPGVSLSSLDKLAEEFILDSGSKPGFKGLYGCPSTLLTSLNSQVVHGLPTRYELQEGDIVSIDCGVYANDYYGDAAYTFALVGTEPDIQNLLTTTQESLYIGIQQATIGNRIGTLANSIQSYCEQRGYSVVQELVGHGLGKKLHEDPQVPNYGRKGTGKKMKEGLVIAIEPMINMGTHRIKQLKDGWTILTADGKNSAHFEHDVAVVNGKPEILSTFQYIYDALGIAPEEYEKV